MVSSRPGSKNKLFQPVLNNRYIRRVCAHKIRHLSYVIKYTLFFTFIKIKRRRVDAKTLARRHRAAPIGARGERSGAVIKHVTKVRPALSQTASIRSLP